MSETLYEYYLQQDVLPTHGAFKTASDLVAHERHRRHLFTDKLKLPPAMFRSARLLEFGPDAAENSLVFAQWGAQCTLAEPNTKAHPIIREYFQRFGLESRLQTLESWDVTNYPVVTDAEEQFDIVDAEGFIYTVQPTSDWVQKCARLTRAEGFVVLFYCEAYSGFFELLLRVIQARYRSLASCTALEAAIQLFQTKWDSIPHKRRIESWTMDVLENPFIRLKFFLEPVALSTEMAAAGMTLYSSWPNYEGGLDLHWFKRVPNLQERLRQQQDFVSRSRLSHLMGRKHFLIGDTQGIEGTLWRLLHLTDVLVDDFCENVATECISCIDSVEILIASSRVLADPSDTRLSVEALRSCRRLLKLLMGTSAKEIATFCNSDAGFIGTWGAPSHFSVFQKLDLP